MRTVTFKSVLEGVAKLKGVDPATMNATDKLVWTEFINQRVAEGWEHEFWPEATVLEQRLFRDTYSAENTYAAPTAAGASEVYFPATDQYFQALQATTGNDPAVLVAGLYQVDYAHWALSMDSYSGAPWAANTQYVGGVVGTPGTIVQNPADGRFYMCLSTHLSGPAFDPTKFAILTPFERYISLDQTGQTPIGTVHQLTRTNPRTNPRFPGPLTFLVNNKGILPAPLCGTKVWVEFRLRCPVFDSTVWSSTEANTPGQIRYRPDTTGECYLALLAGTNLVPESSPAYWQKIDMPAVLERFIKRAAYADSLREDGQTDKAMAEEQNAYAQLYRASDVALASQGQYERAAAQVY